MSQIIVTKLAITGMHCSACAMNIDFDLEDMEGVVSIKTSYATQTAEIRFDADVVDLEMILKQLQKIGYQALPISRDE